MHSIFMDICHKMNFKKNTTSDLQQIERIVFQLHIFIYKTSLIDIIHCIDYAPDPKIRLYVVVLHKGLIMSATNDYVFQYITE